MRKRRFYYLLMKNEREYGLARAASIVDFTFGKEAVPVTIPEGLFFSIESDKKFAPFEYTDTRASLVNEELKQLIKDYIPSDFPLKFIPMKIRSDAGEERQYYLLHFTKIFDVIDVEHSKCIAPGDITVPTICYEKAKDLDFFNSIARYDGFIVSDRLMKEMKKRHLNGGLQFWEWKSM
ncbi:MAG: hypothetical protein IJR02_05085 [Bacteroidaceae bacterium]|nr:hypothetical protein [Bacteroidaceae bacterium]